MFCTEDNVPYSVFSVPELNLRRILPAVYFANTNLPEERVQVLLSEKELSELPDNIPIIFKESNIDQYMQIPNETICNEKYSILDNFSYAKFLAYCTFENKPVKTWEYQPDKLNDKFIVNNYEECSYPQKIKLMISDETMRCQKVKKEKLFGHHLMLFRS